MIGHPPPTRFGPSAVQRTTDADGGRGHPAPPPTRYAAKPVQPAIKARTDARPPSYPIPPTRYGAGTALPKLAPSPRCPPGIPAAPPARAIQRSQDKGGTSSSNVNVYSSLSLSYTQEEIEKAQIEALGRNVHGHQSGNSTSNQSNQTTTEMTKVVDVLRKNKEKEKKAKKKTVIKEESKKTDFWKAIQQVVEFRKQGDDGFALLDAYLNNDQKKRDISDEQQDVLFELLQITDDEKFEAAVDKLLGR